MRDSRLQCFVLVYTSYSHMAERENLSRLSLLALRKRREGLTKVLPPLGEILYPVRCFPQPRLANSDIVVGKQENNGWMDLTKHWTFKHGFLHACRHRPNQADAEGKREPVQPAAAAVAAK